MFVMSVISVYTECDNTGNEQRQTAVTVHLKSKQLLLFAFAGWIRQATLQTDRHIMCHIYGVLYIL